MVGEGEQGWPLLLSLARFGAGPRRFRLRVGAAARERLAARFGLASVDSLSAELEAWRAEGGLAVEGRFAARVVQYCAVSNAPVPAHVEERIAVRFQRLPEEIAEELELEEDQLDILPLAGDEVDLGELVAQSLALALPPYPLAADEVVEEARRQLLRGRGGDRQEERPLSPFARLKPS